MSAFIHLISVLIDKRKRRRPWMADSKKVFFLGKGCSLWECVSEEVGYCKNPIKWSRGFFQSELKGFVN